VSRHEIFGALGVLGGASYAIGGVRMLAFGVGQDPLTDTLGIIWALCWVAGAIGLFELRVTGSFRLARGISGLLVVGFAAAALWGVHRFIDPVAADRGPFAVAPLIVILCMLGTGILMLRATQWRAWRRSVPLFIASVYMATIIAGIITGQSTLGYAFTINGLAFAVLGDSVRAHAADTSAVRAQSA
jgi:hypothetical protein